MTRDEYIKLYEKYVSGRCTPEEQRLLERYEDDFNLTDREWNTDLLGSAQEMKETIYKSLHHSIYTPKGGRIITLKRWWMAAAMVLLISAGLYVGLKNFTTGPAITKTRSVPFKNDVRPGNNKAVLTLEDGKLIILEEAKNGIVASGGTVKVKKIANGKVVYTINRNGKRTKTVTYHTLTTPLGGQYQVILPDGSKAWLNAGSSLRFPTSFPGNERRVELKGEAYFEVAKNKAIPFNVYANGVQIKVLGTQFNVMAYENEKDVNTTLLEGSVQVLKGSGEVKLEPGQQAVLNRNTGGMKVSTADLEQAVAWKNGYFIFNNENIESIMRKISRWYNVDVQYKGNLSNKDFVGSISRDKNVSEILRMLELTGAIHFNIEGRRITVMP